MSVIINPDDEGIRSLLDESNTLLEEGNLAEELDTADDGDTTWYQKFTGRLKTEVGSYSGAVKEKLMNMKVKMSAKQEEEQDKEREEAAAASQESGSGKGKRKVTLGLNINSSKLLDETFKNKVVSPTDKTHFRTNILINVTRRIQKLVSNHGFALDFLQHLINKLEARIKIVEDKVDKMPDVQVQQAWVEEEIEKAMAGLKGKVEKLEKEKEDLVLKLEKEKEDLVQKTKTEKEEVEKEVDRTRQWGMKGNIIISTLKDKQDKLEPQTVGGSVESVSAMCRRLITEKTGVHIMDTDILACHSFGRKGQKSMIVKIHNHKADSGWETLTAGMVSGKHLNGNFVQNGVFLGFQLTERRKEILRNVRDARKKDQLKKFKVDQNGRIWITFEKGVKDVKSTLKYHEVSSLDELTSLCPRVVLLPKVVRQERQQVVQQGGSQ